MSHFWKGKRKYKRKNHDALIFSKDADGKRLHVPERFTEAFDDLVVHINYLPPRVPMPIVWNKHLSHFDSTREHQFYQAFAFLTSDLPFNYGSLTAWRTSFRPWLGSTYMPAFDVPGLEFFATTGEYQGEMEKEIRQEHGYHTYRLPTDSSP